MKTKKIIALALAATMAVGAGSALVGCGNSGSSKKPTPDNPDTPSRSADFSKTLRVGYSNFNEKFSPFFAETAYDQDVAGMTQVGLLTSDRTGAIIYKGKTGETVKYNGTDYAYHGLADLTITSNEDGTVVYDFDMRNDVYFSDGKQLTADDVIFSMYVLADPSYDGSSTFFALPIKGMDAYRAGMQVKWRLIDDDLVNESNDNAAYYTEADKTAFITAYNAAGKALAQEIVDYCVANNGSYLSYCFNNEVALGMFAWGFGGRSVAYSEDAAGVYGATTEGDKTNYFDLYTVAPEDVADEDVEFSIGEAKYVAATAETADADLVYVSEANDDDEPTAVAAYTGTRYKGTPYFKDSNGKTYTMEGTNVPTIDDYWNCLFKAYGYDVSDSGLNREAAASSVPALIAERLSADMVKAVTTGTSASTITGIEKTGDFGVKVTLTEVDATAIYQLGVTVTPMHYYGDESKYNYAQGKFGFDKGDISTVRSKTTKPMGAGPYKFVKYENGVVTFAANENYYLGSPLTGNVQFVESQDKDKLNGVITGTIDITDPSFNDVAIKAIQDANSNGTLYGDKVTINAVDNLGYGYCGMSAKAIKVGTDGSSTKSKNLRKGLATVISVYRDMSVNSYYHERASVINYPISNTSWAAPQAADEGYKVAFSTDVNGNSIYTAGMSLDEKVAAAKAAALGFFEKAGYTVSDGKVTAAPEGGRTSFEALVPADGKGDHPAFNMLTEASVALKAIGIDLKVTDLANSSELWDKIKADKADMWCAAWGATVDPDMYQIYFSGMEGKAAGGSNYMYDIDDAELNQLILDARKSLDQSERKAMYKDCLDIIIDWAVEIPVYQRQNVIVFSPQRVKMDTVTPDITTFYGWMAEIENLQLK